MGGYERTNPGADDQHGLELGLGNGLSVRADDAITT
jgi:hypothetical protein